MDLNQINSDPMFYESPTEMFNLYVNGPKNERNHANDPKIKYEFKENKTKNTLRNEQMTNLNIPDFLQHSYLNGLPPPIISSFRDWQAQLFSDERWKQGKSAIVLVPTSGGKTVAADVAIAQLLEKDPTAKAIYALPFVALANEKFNEYNQRFFQFSVRAYYQNIGGADFRRGNIAVCTYEKAHSIINVAQMGNYVDKIKLIIIDEIHMIGEEYRGPVIEALIVKALLMNHSPRIIGLTATINKSDADLLSKWINGFSFISDTRPSQVRQYIVKNDGDLVLIQNGELGYKVASLIPVNSEAKFVMDPIRRLLSKSLDQTVLIFVNKRADTLSLGTLISEKLYDSSINLPKISKPSSEILFKRRTLIQNLNQASGFIDDRMRKCIINGIGIHHAGLLLEERKLIENGAKEKVLNIIVATTTLSAGVNIHSVARVFIMNAFRNNKDTQIAIPPAQYTQMVGRAGRTSKRNGEAFIFSNSTTDTEIRTILSLSKHEISDIQPHLTDDGPLDRFFLQCLSTKLVSPVGGLKDFVSKTLKVQKTIYGKDENEIESSIDEQLVIVKQRLIDQNLIKKETQIPTALGRAIAASSLEIEEGLKLYETVQKALNDLCLGDEIHLLYLCIPPHFAEIIHPQPYNTKRWIYIAQKHRHVIKLITGLNDSDIDRLQDLPNIYGGKGHINPKIDDDLDKIYASVILRELINETSVAEITRKFQIDRGNLQSLQMDAATFAGQTAKFCEIIGAGLLSATLASVKQRLNFAARSEILGLMILPSMSKEIARILVNVGITSPKELSEISVDGIAALIVMRDENDDSIHPPTEKDKEKAALLLKEAQEYTESVTKLEILEETAIHNFS